MNLVADEGVDRPVVERLRQDGHHVVYVAELSRSVADEEVLQQANEGSALRHGADGLRPRLIPHVDMTSAVGPRPGSKALKALRRRRRRKQ